MVKFYENSVVDYVMPTDEICIQQLIQWFLMEFQQVIVFIMYSRSFWITKEIHIKFTN